MIRSRKFQLLVAFSLVISSFAFSQSDELRILPLGNSLTYGYYDGSFDDGDKVAYRKKLYDNLNAAGYNFNFVGHQYTGFSKFPDAENGGIKGIHDEELSQVMQMGYFMDGGWEKVDVVYPNQPYLNVYPADLILIHIGTNDWYTDEYNGYQVDDVLGVFDAVDAYEAANSTEVLIIICRIINSKNYTGECDGPNADWRIEHYNNELETIINARIAGGDKVKLIDMQCGAGIDYSTDMLDQFHPNQTGYDKMGQHWFDEIDNIHSAPSITSFSFDAAGQGEAFPSLDLDDYVVDDYTIDSEIEWTTASAPVNYNVSISGGNVLTVSPKNAEWIGSEEITFIATDKGRYIEKLKKSSSIAVNFNTIDVNETPVILSQITAFNLNEDTDFDIQLSDLEIQDDNPPTDWTLNIKAGDNYSYSGSTITPDANYDEQLLVNVSVSDLEEESDVFQVVVNYNPINDAPVITSGGPLNIDEDNARTISLSDLVYTDPDNTAGEMTLYVLSGENYTVNETEITPLPDFFGNLNVGVRIRDLSLYSNTYELTINVASVNDAPVITSTPDTLTGDGEEYTYQLIASDVDATGALAYTAIAKPGWLSLSTSGLLSGTPTLNQLGFHHVVLGVSDGDLTTEQDFRIEVKHYNTPPEFTSFPDTIAELDSPYNYKVEADDVDDDEIRFIALKIPAFLDFLSLHGYLIGTPKPENQGVHPVEIGASDGQDTTIMKFNLYVGELNVPTLISSEGVIKVYPNPASSVLNIEPLVSGDVTSLRIMNIMGSIVLDQNNLYYRDEKIVLDIDHLPKGSYLLQLNINSSIVTHRFVIAD